MSKQRSLGSILSPTGTCLVYLTITQVHWNIWQFISLENTNPQLMLLRLSHRVNQFCLGSTLALTTYFLHPSHIIVRRKMICSLNPSFICFKLSFAISRCQDICVSYLRLHPQLTSLAVRVSLCWDLHSYHPITFQYIQVCVDSYHTNMNILCVDNYYISCMHY